MATMLAASACRGDDGSPETGGDTEGGDSTTGPTGPGPGSDASTTTDSGTTTDDPTGNDTMDPPDPPEPTSPKANVKFKGPKRLANDLAQALALAPEEVCVELGDQSCTDEVHTVTLGGVEPYRLGIYEPSDESVVTTPIAVDRVVLSACARRVDMDLQGSPVVFDLELDGAGLSDADAPSVHDSLDRLYTRGLLRHPEGHEVAALQGLYAQVEMTSTDAPARDWAVASCFAVLSTMEFLFY